MHTTSTKVTISEQDGEQGRYCVKHMLICLHCVYLHV